MTAGFYTDYFAAAKGFWNTSKACQAYVIAMGVNDIYNNKMEIGSIYDINSENYKNNKEKFAGYYANIISNHKEIGLDANFFLVTFPNENDPDKEKAAKEMRSLLYDFAEIFDNTYVLDIYQYVPAYDQEFKEKYFSHGHMNPMGYLFTAKNDRFV